MIIPQGFKLTTGPDKHGRTVYALLKLNIFRHNEDTYIKSWYHDPNDAMSQPPTQKDIDLEIELSDYSRWNKGLPKDQIVEVNKYVYEQMLCVLPPRNWGKHNRHYFEVGEAHHHENGRAIHRAFWIKDGRYYTGHPDMAAKNLSENIVN